jgi:S-adenosylmethionine:tRNA ribosyltransferase-isomerase
MRRDSLAFPRPPELVAREPPEVRAGTRDAVRLLVSSPGEHRLTHFRDLRDFLRPEDLLVVNESATLPASLPAEASFGSFRLHYSTRYGPRLYLMEPRRSLREPGPLPLHEGMPGLAGGVPVRFLVPHPGIPRLWFVQGPVDLDEVLGRVGSPIRYGYVEHPWPLEAYQTIFARVPGSAEMPSAARPFSREVVGGLSSRGIGIARILLHCGVSSLEVEADRLEDQVLYAEPFEVPAETARAVREAHRRGGRVIAVGTTVVRALESAVGCGGIQPTRGFTRLYVHPPAPLRVVDGLLTGLHDPMTSHLALLFALAGEAFVHAAYREAVEAKLLWHEFGDSHLLLPSPRTGTAS